MNGNKAALAALLTAANISYTSNANEIRIRGGSGPNNEGDAAFVAVFYFRTTGEMESVAVWELPLAGNATEREDEAA